MPYKDPIKKKEFQKKYHDNYDSSYYQRNLDKYRKYTKHYNKNIRKPRLVEMKGRAVEYKGGKCSRCGGEPHRGPEDHQAGRRHDHGRAGPQGH